MEVSYTDAFERQRVKYSFRFTCDHCAHYDEERRVCLHGFPNEMHVLDLYLADEKPATILFCKDFDLA